MKTLLPMLFLIVGLGLMSSSCNNKIKNDVSAEEKEVISDIEHTGVKPEMTPHNMEESCHGVRKTVRTVVDKEGEIMHIGENILISIPPGTRRYSICEDDIPKELNRKGNKVRFTGEVLEIFHNERLMGTPIRITNIEIIK